MRGDAPASEAGKCGLSKAERQVCLPRTTRSPEQYPPALRLDGINIHFYQNSIFGGFPHGGKLHQRTGEMRGRALTETDADSFDNLPRLTSNLTPLTSEDSK
ncbi:MAG: hypothetical protein PWP70_636 [Moorella sp. (in: firmicutes)]|nr:hypothetical protein [Moorella sp. (in: firmicutes)]